MSLEDAGEVVNLALECHAATDNRCVGLDLSGDPMVGMSLVLFIEKKKSRFFGHYDKHG